MTVSSDYSAPIIGSKLSKIVKNNFSLLLILSSTIGFVMIPLTHSVYWPFKESLDLYHFLIYVSGAHIGFTYFFYFDKEAKNIRQAQWLRFHIIPVLLMCIMFFSFLYASTTGVVYLWQIIGIWTIWHFQRQNLGVFTFLCIDQGLKTASKFERQLILGSGIVAMAANLLTYGKGIAGTLFEVYRNQIFTISLAGYISMLLLWIASLIWKKLQINVPIFSTRNTILLLFITYYWPLFIIKEPTVAFMMFAVGHGLQYILFMSIIATQGRDRLAFKGLNLIFSKLNFVANLSKFSFQLLFLFCVGFLIFALANYFSLVEVKQLLGLNLKQGLAGLAFSATAVHYVLDSGIWRLSQPLPRNYAKHNFDFVFSKSSKLS